jgi:phosphoinositide-3-kinase regulatory subunit 4
MYLDGRPLFSLSQLLKYRKREHDPATTLEKIEDPDIRLLIKHMISLNPQDRGSAQDHLRQW